MMNVRKKGRQTTTVEEDEGRFVLLVSILGPDVQLQTVLALVVIVRLVCEIRHDP
jgi:hypothetical protein